MDIKKKEFITVGDNNKGRKVGEVNKALGLFDMLVLLNTVHSFSYILTRQENLFHMPFSADPYNFNQ